MLVDDEEIALSSLNALFTLETDYETLSFNDPREAVIEARRRPIDLVISDYLMPQMTGIDLLKDLERVQPDMVKVLLTGFADKENTIRAINELDLFQYLEKPWDNQQLLLVVRRGIEQRGLTQQLTGKIKELDRVLTEHHDLQQRHDALERELEMAARVQRSLLPEAIPDAGDLRFTCLYQPCHEIGGDFYGLKEAGDRSILLLADVSGHGVQAALTSMLLKAIFEEACNRTQSALELVGSMNGALHRYLPSSMYAAATIAWMEGTGDEGRLQLVNAGLPYPFLLRAGEDRVDELPISGMPLGIFGKGGPAAFDQKELELARGDVLLLASDGLGDVQGEGDECFQDRRLREVLRELNGHPGEKLIQELVARAIQFAGGRPAPDDISLLAITRS